MDAVDKRVMGDYGTDFKDFSPDSINKLAYMDTNFLLLQLKNVFHMEFSY